MNKLRHKTFLLALSMFLLVIFMSIYTNFGKATAQSTAPLPSWNDGAAKQAIIEFVQLTTDKSSSKYVEPEDRIATFDQDGTLWVEHPIYTQAVFALDRLKSLSPQHPEWQTQEPFKAILEGNQEAIAKFTEGDWVQIVAATHAGMTTEAFIKIAQDWQATAKHPRFQKPYTELIYQPMLEVLQYLRDHGFKTYIVTGGGQEFVRIYSDRVYGIPPEQVVGSSIVTKYDYQDGKPVLMREPKVFFIDDHAGKPTGINLFIGKRPYAAFGNSDGDQQMLEYTKFGDGARLSLLVLHDDATREYAYGPAQGLPDTTFGTFTQALYDQAKKDGWIVVSMKNDWKRIFAFEQNAVTAIDIALEPDATMIQHAEAVNARLLKVFPKGFTLDATHHPHISMLQRYVCTADLDKVYAAVGKVLANEKLAGGRLKAFKYYYIPWKDIGLAGIVVEPTDDLLNLQQKLIDAVAPFTVETGTSAAFLTTPDDPDINQPTIDYIAAFVPKATGKNFNPHVTVGIASQDYLKEMLAEPFDVFTFSPEGASVYRLGNNGTARKKLKAWELKP